MARHTAFEFFNTALLFCNCFSLGVLVPDLPRSVIPQLNPSHTRQAPVQKRDDAIDGGFGASEQELGVMGLQF
jgi:hypothetical protein